MTNTELLKNAISDSGLKIETILKLLGMKSYATLRSRIAGETEFTASEISALSDILNLSNAERDKIFFACDAE